MDSPHSGSTMCLSCLIFLKIFKENESMSRSPIIRLDMAKRSFSLVDIDAEE